MSGPHHDPLAAPPAGAVRRAVAAALAEDLGPLGDITAALVPGETTARGILVARQPGVLAGTACATEAFAQVDSGLELRWQLTDGAALSPGTVIGEVSGALRSMLTAERTALNFLCHLSGVASLTRRYVDAVQAANAATRVLDTRKTTPGLRALEKAAVRAGGGTNHRASLSDAVLVKDNHLAGLSIAGAVSEARRRWPGRMVEVECDTAAQVKEAASAGADVVMVDNMDPDQVAVCVAEIRADAAGRAPLVEVSGGVKLEQAPRYAAAGADLVSVGALTHSAPALDIGLDVALDTGAGD
ncbi:MAG TPA: carboxylating nicotinate-nucleotide diphosphorylase [Acidimicrobiales bacterium]|nr:carboxylating nicotinate-nucleotide diphosphorylase [Acidimicrobiales bacterium]